MKTNVSKCAIIMVALVLSTFSLTMVGINVAKGGMQKASALLFVNPKTATPTSVKVAATTPVSGKYAIGVTISEDFLKPGSEKIKKELFVGNKKYEIVGNNIASEIKSGFYDVVGTLDTKTSIVTLTSAKFAGEVFDGLKEGAVTKTLATTTKKKKVAVFLMDYQDSATQPFYPSTVNEIMFGNGKFKQYFNEASYGRQPIAGDVFGWHTIPQNATGGVCQGNVETDVATVVAGNGQINLNNYSNIVIVTLCPGDVSYGMSNTGPQPYIINGTLYNKTVTWVSTSASKWNQVSDMLQESMTTTFIPTNLEWLLMHEFGHALGLTHAHGLSCEETLPTANCQSIGLGNRFDVMAYNTIGLHMNAWAKAKLGWFTSTELGTITQSGTYTIASLESQPSTNQQLISAVKAYKIKPSANSNKTPIWIEFRRATGFDSGISTPALGGMQGNGGEVPPHNIADNQNGIFVYKQGFESMYSGTLNPETARLMYLRGAPNLGTSSNPYQVSLNVGQTYSDPRYGLTITTLSPLNSNTRRFQVTMNPTLACTTLPPKLNLWRPNNTPVAVGSAITVNGFMTNMDYISCPNSNFTYSFDFGGLTQNGSTSNLTTFLSNLAPDDERQFLFGVYAPAGTAPGTYTISATITNQTSLLSTTSTLPVIVQ